MAFAKSQKSASGVTDDIGTSPDVVQLSSFTSQDLYALGPGGVSAPRGIMVTNVGVGTKSLVVTTVAGNQRTIDATNLQSAYLPVAVKSVDAATSVVTVLLFY